MIFTFGPYGFVQELLPITRGTAALALVYTLVVTWALAGLLVAALRPAWGLIGATVAAWASVCLASNLLEAPQLAMVTALGLALASLQVANGRQRLALLVALGSLAGFQVLVEITVGLVSWALLVLALVAFVLPGPDAGSTSGTAPRRGPGPSRASALVAGAVPAVVVPALALVAGGQSLGNFPSYLRGSLQVALGYSSAMSMSGGRVAEDFFAAADLAMAAAVFRAALRGRPGRQQAIVGLMLAGWTWEVLKEGFVRHDLHDLTFFASLTVALGLARLARGQGRYQVAAMALAAVLTCLAAPGVPRSLRSPLEDTRALSQEVLDLAGSARWAKVEAVARSQVRSTGDALPASLLVAVSGGRSMASVTQEDALSFSYSWLDWDPEPVLQAYSAYTPYLDHLDAGFLSSSHAPQRVLYQPDTIDGRNVFWDSPAAVEAMYCHYAPSEAADGWLLLDRVSDRCGATSVIGRTSARFGTVVKVPSPPARDQMVVAEFSLAQPLWAELEGPLFKPPRVELEAWPAGGGAAVEYRFVAGTAADPHVLSLPAVLGYPTTFSPVPVLKLEFSGGGWPAGDGRVRVTFLAVPVVR
jgi:hypothetical protein